MVYVVFAGQASLGLCNSECWYDSFDDDLDMGLDDCLHCCMK